VEGFNERINQVSNQVVSVEERIVNLTRLVKLLQINDESHEQELSRLNNLIKGNKVVHKSDVPEDERMVIQLIIIEFVRGEDN
jgi:ribosomal protein S8E